MLHCLLSTNKIWASFEMQISFLIYQNVLFCCSDGFVITGIRCFSLGLPMKNNLCFSFVLHLPKFRVSSRYPLLVPVYHTVGTSFCRAVPVMYCICSLKSQMTKCSQTVTIFRWCSNVFCTWSKLRLFTQPSHLLRKKTPFQGRNTTSSFLVPSGKNKLCNRVNVLSEQPDRSSHLIAPENISPAMPIK